MDVLLANFTVGLSESAYILLYSRQDEFPPDGIGDNFEPLSNEDISCASDLPTNRRDGIRIIRTVLHDSDHTKPKLHCGPNRAF